MRALVQERLNELSALPAALPREAAGVAKGVEADPREHACIRAWLAWDASGPGEAKALAARAIQANSAAEKKKPMLRELLLVASVDGSLDGWREAFREASSAFSDHAVPVALVAYAAARATGRDAAAAEFAALLKGWSRLPRFDVTESGKAVLRAIREGAGEESIRPELGIALSQVSYRDAAFVVGIAALLRGEDARAKEALERYMKEADPRLARGILARMK
jgi:hypothetical protein